MTLKDTGAIVTPAGVAGVTFADEADTANALVPQLKAQGADAIVILLHQGGQTTGGYNDKSCPNLTGDILPILARLDPAVDAVISGHTHRSYICELPRNGAHPLLLTSAGKLRHADQRHPPDFLPRSPSGRPARRQHHRPGRALFDGAGHSPDRLLLSGLSRRSRKSRALVSRYAAAAAPAGQPGRRAFVRVRSPGR